MGCVSWKLEFPFWEAPQLNADWPPAWPELPYLPVLLPSPTFPCLSRQVDSTCQHVFPWSGTSHAPSLAVTEDGAAQLRPRLDCKPPGPVSGPRLVSMHLPGSSLSPTPTWKTLKNHQSKPVLCPCTLSGAAACFACEGDLQGNCFRLLVPKT